MWHIDHAEGNIETIVSIQIVFELNGFVIPMCGLVRPQLTLVGEPEVEHDVPQIWPHAFLAIHDAQFESIVFLEEFVL